jgi:hypothetical protein
MLKAQADPSLRSVTTLIAILFLALGGCADIRDRDIASMFARDQVTFEGLAQIGISAGLSCYEARDGSLQCSNASARPLFEQLHQKDGVRAIQAKAGGAQAGKAVYFVVASYGPITTNSYSKGLVYATAPLSPLVENTDDHPEVPRRYKPLGGNWYVFTTP